MADYAAVVSLKQTIKRLLNSSHISVVFSSHEILESAYNVVQSLQEFLQDIDKSSNRRKRANDALKSQINVAVHKLEDVLESDVSDMILSQSRCHGDEATIRQEINSFAETIMKMEEEYLLLPEEEEENDDDEVLSRTDFGGNEPRIIGSSKELEKIISRLRAPPPNTKITSIVGMAGIGKTAIAKKTFENPLIVSFYQARAWVTVGRTYQLNQISQNILTQIFHQPEQKFTNGYEKLYPSSYLIVLDDIWDLHVWEEMKNLPIYEKSKFLLTTRLQKVARDASVSYSDDPVIQVQFLNSKESWDLLRQEVFGERSCPPELEEAGMRIAENCDGLPLTIVTVANILSEGEKTPEHWNRVAATNFVFMEAYRRIYKVLYPSYDHLPQHLKASFLYLGVFPQKFEIPKSKLIMLWNVEGFLEPNSSENLADLVGKYVEEIHSRSLVLIRQQCSSGGIKTCSLHSVFWYLCNVEADKNKFFKVLNSYVDCSRQGLESQRRLSINNNVLFSIQDGRNSIASTPTVRSLLCLGSYHQYQLSICFGLRLLRIFDVLTIRFYEFPMEVLKLVHLRYLALTYNGNLPSSISKLWNLQFFIVHQHLRINSSNGAPSYLPMEIWGMKELKHLQVAGSNLPHPNSDALLPNLHRLLDVSTHSCTKAILEKIPNLEKLGIQIEVAPDDVEPPPLSCFDHISDLKELKSLKIVILTPTLRSEVVAPHLPNLPTCLKKLSFSGLSYPWEEMSKIASLPNLEVLKLRNYAFRGPKWEVCDREFYKLKLLVVEDTDLIDWRIIGFSFVHIKRIIMKNCYRLKDIPLRLWNDVQVDLVDCNPPAAIFKTQDYMPVRYRKVYAKHSWK